MYGEQNIVIIVSLTCFENPSFHPQEDLYIQFYGISFMHSYKQSGRWQDVPDHVFLRMDTCMFETCRRHYN